MLKESIVLNEEAAHLEEMLDLNESGYYDINYIFGGDDEHDGEEFEYPVPEDDVINFILNAAKKDQNKMELLIKDYNDNEYDDEGEDWPAQIDLNTPNLDKILYDFIDTDIDYYVDLLGLEYELKDYYEEDAKEDAREGKLARDPYSYYGVSRRDFY